MTKNGKKSVSVLITFIMVLVLVLSVFPFNALAASIGENLLKNGDFENGFDNWGNEFGDAYTIDSTTSYSGNNSCKTNRSVSVLRYTNIAVEANTNYTLSVYVKKSTAAASAWIDANLAPESDAPAYQAGRADASDAAIGAWERIEVNFNTGDTTEINVRCIGENIDSSNYAWFDNMSLTKEPEAMPSSNMIKDPTFKDGISKWDLSSSDFTVTHDSSKSVSNDGSGSMKVDYSSHIEGHAYRYFQGWYKDLEMEDGMTYTLSFWYYAETGTPDIMVQYREGGNYTSQETTGDGSVKNAWTKITHTFVPHDVGNFPWFRILTTDDATSGSIWIDNVSFVEGYEDGKPVNMIKDPSFSEGISNWDLSSSDFTVTHDPNKSAIEDSTGSMKVDYSSHIEGHANRFFQGWYKDLKMEPGNTYTISFWYYAEDGTPDIMVQYREGGNYTSQETTGDGSVKNAWTKITHTFVPSSVDGFPWFRILTTGEATGGSIWIDEVSFIKGEEVEEPIVTPDKSLISNGSFENGTGGNADNWIEEANVQRASVEEIEQKYGEKYDLTKFKEGVDGDHVMMFTHTSTRVVKASGAIDVKPNTNYLFKANIYRTDGRGVSYISLLDGNGADLPGTSSGTETLNDWITVTVTWNSGNATKVIPRMVIDNSPSGEPIFFDDLQFLELDYNVTNPLPEDVELSPDAIDFDLSTKETFANIAFDNNKVFITSLTDKNSNSWISAPQEIQLINSISGKDVEWVLNGNPKKVKVEEETDKGWRLTANFVSADSLYSMNVYFEALDSSGPIEFWSDITCNSTESYYTYADVISSNMRLNKQDGDTTLYYFNRGRVNDGSDPLFLKGGILTENLSSDQVIVNSVENGCNVTTGTLPYQMIDVNGNRGFYYGYYWSFGKLIVRTQSDGDIGVTTMLSNDPTAKVTRKAGETMNIPSYFFGTYTGDIDDGANHMKNWFWDYKITRSLHDNEDEPHIETDTMSSNPETITKMFTQIAPELKDIVQTIKLDYGWTLPAGVDPQVDKVTENKWLPGPRWSDGMLNWATLNELGINFSLYMCNTFEGADIGTEEGRLAQLNALKERFGTAENRSTNSGWATDVHGYDYWRSDFDVEGTYDYAKHEGLLYILDEMIKYSDEFRYEHCSGGGSLKDFSTLERMSFMTNEDTAMAINHRICLYAASYMINPVQLKADLNMTYNNKDFGAIRKDNPEHTYSTSPYVCTDESGNMMNVWEDPEYILYSLRSGFLGSTMVCFNEEGLTLNKDLIAEQWKLYEEKQRPILRGANVYHILEQPSGIPWDWADWDGLMFYNDELDEGSVLLFRENDEVNGTKVPTEKTIKLKGLDKNATYNVTFEDRTNLSGKFTGAQLMEEGLYVNDMTKAHDSECIFIAKAAPEVPVEGITIEGNDSVVEGQSIQLTATVTPDNATDKSITWSIVSGEEFASIDQNGLVNATAEGSITVKALSKADNKVYATKEITITAKPAVPVEEITIAGNNEVKVGESIQLTATVTPDNATDKSITWSIVSGEEFASVDQNGLVSAAAEGSVTVKVVSNANNDVFATFDITIKEDTVAPTVTVEITNIVYEPKKGETGKYEVSVKPEGTTGKVVFASSAPSILKVNDDGSWEALAEGEARLSVSIGDVTKSYIIKVKDSTNSPTKPVDPDNSNKPIEPDNPNNNAIDQPKTGDASNIWLWAMLLVLAAGAGATVIYIRKKYSSKTK